MEEKKLLIDNSAIQPKRVYVKPVLSKIRLVADEAVLALCKFNNPGDICSGAIICAETASS